MNLSMDDLRHVHKVLSSDVKECQIHFNESDNGGFRTRMAKRIGHDNLVLARIERIIGRKPKYATRTEAGMVPL